MGGEGEIIKREPFVKVCGAEKCPFEQMQIDQCEA
jgi:hypothetical protein